MDKINELSAGSYNVTVSFNDGHEVTSGKLILEEELENPDTSDATVMYIIIGIVSLVGITGGSVVARKKVFVD